MGSDDPNLYKTTNYGNTWNYLSTPSGGNPYFISEDTGFTEFVGIFKTVDGGSNWSTVLSSNYYLTGFYFSPDKSYAFASGITFSGDSIVVFKSTDRGNSWNYISGYQSLAGQVAFSGITFTSPDTGYITGDGIRKTTDGGLNWIMLDNSPDYTGIYFPASDTGYAISNIIAKTTDGQHWINLPQSTFGIINYGAFLSSTEGYVVGEDLSFQGFILKTIDGGQNWTTEKTTPMGLYSISFPSTNFGYAFGPDGAIYKRQPLTFINNILYKSEINAFPNPSNGVFHITSNCKKNNATIKIFDSIGILVKVIPFQYEIDLSYFEKGIYIVKIRDSTSSEILKLIVN
jgi:photosystem II stability/assembly factor-like uncharacterized protein